MKYQPGLLDAFISPITGKIRSASLLPLQEDYTFVGDQNNSAVESPILIDLRLEIIEILTNLSQARFIMQTAKQGFGHSQALDELQDGILRHENGVVMIATDVLSNHLPKDNVFVGNDSNIATPQPTINFSNLPNLTFNNLLRGDITNRPQEITRISESNLPELGVSVNPLFLGKGMIWRGTFSGTAEASNDLSALENSLTILQTITMPAAITAATQALHFIVQGEIAVASAATLTAATAAIGVAIGSLRLNNIGVSGDVSFGGYKLIDLGDPVNPTDGVNLRTLEAAISGSVNNISLDGFVLGNSDPNGLIHTTRGPLCLLSNIPAGGDVSMDSFRITNLGDYQADNDAISVQGVWDLINSPDFVAPHIHPELHMLSDMQQFVFNARFNKNTFQVMNLFNPTAEIKSKNILELRNKSYSGYRFTQETSDISNSGDLKLTRYIDSNEEDDEIISFSEESDNLKLGKILNANDKRIINVPLEPEADRDAISFEFLWNVLNDEVF
jgi:hypothetical protein